MSVTCTPLGMVRTQLATMRFEVEEITLDSSGHPTFVISCDFSGRMIGVPVTFIATCPDDVNLWNPASIGWATNKTMYWGNRETPNELAHRIIETIDTDDCR